MKPYIVMDAETQLLSNQVEGGWSNVYGMKIASCVTYDSLTDQYMFWEYKDHENLLKYMNGKLIVSFNGIRFDSKLLLGDKRIIEPNGITRNDKYWWINADLYIEIWRHILSMNKTDYPKIIEALQKQHFKGGIFGLDDIARATLNREKSGHGEDAPVLYQQKRMIELFGYNLQDVRVTKKLYQFIQQHRYCVTGAYDIVKFL
jgi:hypothetical protein